MNLLLGAIASDGNIAFGVFEKIGISPMTSQFDRIILLFEDFVFMVFIVINNMMIEQKIMTVAIVGHNAVAASKINIISCILLRSWIKRTSIKN